MLAAIRVFESTEAGALALGCEFNIGLCATDLVLFSVCGPGRFQANAKLSPTSPTAMSLSLVFRKSPNPQNPFPQESKT